VYGKELVQSEEKLERTQSKAPGK